MLCVFEHQCVLVRFVQFVLQFVSELCIFWSVNREVSVCW